MCESCGFIDMWKITSRFELISFFCWRWSYYLQRAVKSATFVTSWSRKCIIQATPNTVRQTRGGKRAWKLSPKHQIKLKHFFSGTSLVRLAFVSSAVIWFLPRLRHAQYFVKLEKALKNIDFARSRKVKARGSLDCETKVYQHFTEANQSN